MKQLTWDEVIRLMSRNGDVIEDTLVRDLTNIKNHYEPDKFILLVCAVLDSSFAGQYIVAPVGGKATLKEIPNKPFSPRGIASDISEVVGYFLPTDVPKYKQMRYIKDIAKQITTDWKKVYFGALPYLDAMYSLETMDDLYGMESAKSIITYFLANAQTWRGQVARDIKKELNNMVKASKR